MTEKETIFYAQIGLISTAFAKLEHLIREIIHLLINADNEFVSQLVIQENNISQNQKLMLQLNKYRAAEEQEIREFNKKIDRLRINRNLFIHGDWKIIQNDVGEMVFVCSTTRVTFKRIIYGTMTQRNTYDVFRLADLEKEVEQIRECIVMATSICATLKETPF